MTEQPGQSTADPKQSERSPVLVAGKALQSWPEDLYIPPDALEVILDAFQGPLDLLLYLIRKQNIDILDIPVAEITRQYMEYVELMRRLHLDLAAEYLVMAAMLAWMAEQERKMIDGASRPGWQRGRQGAYAWAVFPCR